MQTRFEMQQDYFRKQLDAVPDEKLAREQVVATYMVAMQQHEMLDVLKTIKKAIEKNVVEDEPSSRSSRQFAPSARKRRQGQSPRRAGRR